jgi:uncharacterized protein (DUF4415 family)
MRTASYRGSRREPLGLLFWIAPVYKCACDDKMKNEYNFSNAKRGAVVKVSKGKSRITIRLDDDVLAWFRKQVDEAGGGNYQTLINAVLRRHIERAEEPIEKVLRRVIGEEIRRAS